MQLDEFECPNCGAPVTDLSDHKQLHCQFCGTVLDLHRSLCPNCQFINPEGTRFCTQCGDSVIRVCPACKHENWAGVEHCANCGRVLDILEIMQKSRVHDTRARLERQQQEALALKMRETVQAEARMEHYWQMERERQQEVAEREEHARRRERQVLRGLLIGTAVVILLLLVAYVLMTLIGSA